MTGDVNDVMPGSAEDFGIWKKKKKNPVSWDLNSERESWDSSVEEGSRFLVSPSRDQLGVYEKCCAFVEEIVSLSPHVDKP